MAEDKFVLLTLSVHPNVKPALREEAARQGFITAQKGSISRFLNHIADRLDSGANPFVHSTFEESAFGSMFEMAESLKTDCSLGEEEVVRILRDIGQRKFIGLQSSALDNVILDIRAILFGDDS